MKISGTITNIKQPHKSCFLTSEVGNIVRIETLNLSPTGFEIEIPESDITFNIKAVPSTEEYHLMLSSHDWYYAYSDDAYVYNRGEESNRRLLEIAKHSYIYSNLYKCMREAAFTKNQQLIKH